MYDLCGNAFALTLHTNPCEWPLLHPCLQTAYHGGGEAGMFHLVKSTDGEAAGGAYIVYLGLGMIAVGLEQVYGTLHGLAALCPWTRRP